MSMSSRTLPALIALALLSVQPAGALAADRVVIDGSTGVMPLVAALAKAYQASNPAALIEIGKGMGTKARIAALQEGRIDIAMASHGLDRPAIERQGMVVHEIGKVAVVFAVHAGVSLTTLDDGQICAIYSGQATSWKDIGGADLPIVAMTRPDSEVDTEVSRDGISCLSKLNMHPNVKLMPKSGDMALALAATPGAVGMTTMTVVEQSRGLVKPLALRQVAPSTANVESKRYTLTRDSFLVARTSASAATGRFMDFVRSPAGAKVIAENGAVPVK